MMAPSHRRPRPRRPAPGAPARRGGSGPNAGGAGWAEEFGILTVANLLLKLRGLLLLPLITRLLGIAPFGVWIQVTAVVSLGSTVAELGLQSAAVRLVAGTEDRDETRQRYWTIFCAALALAAAGGAVLFLAAPLLAAWRPATRRTCMSFVWRRCWCRSPRSPTCRARSPAGCTRSAGTRCSRW